MLNGRFTLTNAVQQEVAFTTIPIFQYAIFYNDLLEFVKAATMTIRGRVHSNGSIYVGGNSPVTFYEDVTAVGIVTKPGVWNGINTTTAEGVISFLQEKITNGTPMTLPIGTNNTSEAVHKVIERPPSDEAPNSAMGKERYYNKSELLLFVSNNVISMRVKTPFSTNATLITNALYFVTTNKSMTDQRQDRTQLLTEIDVAKFNTFITTNATIKSVLNNLVPSLLYVDDNRGGYTTNYSTNIYNTNITHASNAWPGPIVAPVLGIRTNLSATRPSSGNVTLAAIPGNAATNWLDAGVAGQSSARYKYKFIADFVSTNRVTLVTTNIVDGGMGAVRLTNAVSLATNGLTLSTPNGLYVVGHFNCPTSGHLGTTNTSTTRPASLVCDALTILSSNWKDSESGGDYLARNAASTTVNAAILTGNVPSGGSTGSDPASGGAHNLPRFLEDWDDNSAVSTINGSLVCIFQSQQANKRFITTSQTDSYYTAPTRNWSFDRNFLDPNKLPPGTPAVRVLERLKWSTPPPNSTTYAGY